ncbi:hypothetical protein [Sulfurimonas paralvinellae]|nr:hypothetical protein [Sulfurimonas paralvinellae]
MNENIEQASSGGDLLIWAVMFGLLMVIVVYLAWKNKDIER